MAKRVTSEVPILALPLTSCVTLGSVLSLSVPLSSSKKQNKNNSPTLRVTVKNNCVPTGEVLREVPSTHGHLMSGVIITHTGEDHTGERN